MDIKKFEEYSASREELKNEIQSIVGADYNVRVKNKVFVIETTEWDIEQEFAKQVINELENNIGGEYNIDDISQRRVVIFYNL